MIISIKKVFAALIGLEKDPFNIPMLPYSGDQQYLPGLHNSKFIILLFMDFFCLCSKCVLVLWLALICDIVFYVHLI